MSRSLSHQLIFRPATFLVLCLAAYAQVPAIPPLTPLSPDNGQPFNETAALWFVELNSPPAASR